MRLRRRATARGVRIAGKGRIAQKHTAPGRASAGSGVCFGDHFMTFTVSFTWEGLTLEALFSGVTSRYSV